MMKEATSEGFSLEEKFFLETFPDPLIPPTYSKSLSHEIYGINLIYIFNIFFKGWVQHFPTQAVNK